MDIEIRQARPEDAPGVRDVFRAAYGADYYRPEVYDLAALRRWITGADDLVFVAAPPGGAVLGTAMVDFRVRAGDGDVGEFGRLCVRPSACGLGLGSRLMRARLRAAGRRLRLGLSETRAGVPASTAIGLRHGFRPAGFLPSKDRFATRESSVLMVRPFGGAFARRRPVPRLVPEAAPVARLALRALGLPGDVAVAAATEEGPPGRAAGVEVLPVDAPEFEEGLAAHRRGRNAGRLTWRWSRLHRRAVLGTLRAADDAARHALLAAMVEEAERRGALYLEADVGAAELAAQRSLVVLGFRAGGFLPAAAPASSGRQALVRMVRVHPAADLGPLDLHPAVRPMAAAVLEGVGLTSASPAVPSPIGDRSAPGGVPARPAGSGGAGRRDRPGRPISSCVPG